MIPGEFQTLPLKKPGGAGLRLGLFNHHDYFFLGLLELDELDELDELELLELEELEGVVVVVLGVTVGLGGGVVCKLLYCLGTYWPRGVGVTVGVVVLDCTFTPEGACRDLVPSKVAGASFLTSRISCPTLLFSIFCWASCPLLWA